MRSPSARCWLVMRSPLTNVPFVEPRSRMLVTRCGPSLVTRISVCRLEMPGSSKMTSALLSRPRTVMAESRGYRSPSISSQGRWAGWVRAALGATGSRAGGAAAPAASPAGGVHAQSWAEAGSAPEGSEAGEAAEPGAAAGASEGAAGGPAGLAGGHKRDPFGRGGAHAEYPGLKVI